MRGRGAGEGHAREVIIQCVKYVITRLEIFHTFWRISVIISFLQVASNLGQMRQDIGDWVRHVDRAAGQLNLTPTMQHVNGAIVMVHLLSTLNGLGLSFF